MKAQEKYYEAVGRRKCSIARVRVWPASKNSITVNDKDYKEYFLTGESRHRIDELLNHPEVKEKFKVSIKVKGGGISSQAEASSLGIARSVSEYKNEFRKPLKKEGYLKRDPRIKERRKFGLKKARKAPQWSKR